MPSEGNPEGRKRLLPHGGPRRRLADPSWQLKEWQCEALIEAAGVAWEAGLPFNRFVTLAFGKSGIPARNCVTATGEWIKLAREWLHERGFPMPWAWVQEWGPVTEAHCHILLHVPPMMTPLFRGRPSKWSRKVIADHGCHYARGTTDCQKIWCSEHPDRYPEAYQGALTTKVHYMLKCAPAELETKLGMAGLGPRPWGRSCPVHGKRLAIWQGWRGVAEGGYETSPRRP